MIAGSGGVVTNGMVLAAARRRARIVCISDLGVDYPCVEPCTTSWDDWCEATNNKNKVC